MFLYVQPRGFCWNNYHQETCILLINLKTIFGFVRLFGVYFVGDFVRKVK